MNNYIGFLIRQSRLKQNISQDGLCKGICAPSYLCKIEQGQVDASADIIDHLFAALGISYYRDETFLVEAKEHFDNFFSLLDADEAFHMESEYFSRYGQQLENSELHLHYHLYLLFFNIHTRNKESAGAEQAYLQQFIKYMDENQKARYYLGAAQNIGYTEEAVQLLLEAARHGDNSLIYYQMATVFYHIGQYSESIEKAEKAYRLASDEGNPSVLIGASFLLGSCYCNHRDIAVSKKYYERAIALTRGYKIQVKSYAYYNLGTAYLSCQYYEEALYYLFNAGDLEDEAYHNVMLYQKLSILYTQTGNVKKAAEQLGLAKECLAVSQVETKEYSLYEQMICFAEFLQNKDYLDSDKYEAVLKALYEQVDKPFGFGFRRFYGAFLVQLYKYQRKYKEALRVKEEMDIS